MKLEFLILDFIQKYMHTPLGDYIMLKITALGDNGIVWILTAIVLTFSKKHKKTGFAMAAALLLSFLIGNLTLKLLFERARPFANQPDVLLLIPPPLDYSFPSAHTMSSFSAATVAYLSNRKMGTFALILASLIAFSRLYLYVHFPSDIVAGLVLGIICGLIAWSIVPPKAKDIHNPHIGSR